MLAACTASGSADAAPAPTPTVAPDCAPTREAAPGTTVETFTGAGQVREYLLTVPDDYDGTTAVPMVLSFHGLTGNKEAHEANTSMGKVGGERGYVVVTPGALGQPSQWNAFAVPNMADDYSYIQALVTELSQKLCIDTDRVFAAGHSNGSAFSAFLVCRPPFQFAGVAMVSATTSNTCPDDVNPATLAVHGTADTTVPFMGGRINDSALILPSAPELIRKYVTDRACDPTPTLTMPHPGVQRATYGACLGGSEVVFDTVAGGTHSWPGGRNAASEPTNSEAGKTYDTTNAIFDFFDAH
jgi:polyhydroxybutyrate depolymerase